MGEWGAQQENTVSEDINSAGRSRLRTCGRLEPSSQTELKRELAEKKRSPQRQPFGYHPGAERAESVAVL